MTEQKLLPIDHCRHLAFAAIGGFFGGYALLCRGGILGSSQTMNLVELVIDALFGRGSSVLLHLLCLVIYVVGVMLSVIVPHVFHVDMRRLSPCITAAAAIAHGLFPGGYDSAGGTVSGVLLHEHPVEHLCRRQRLPERHYL